MTDLKTREDVEAPARPPILDVLPAVLRRQPGSDACFCSHCAPSLSETQRSARERVKDDWRITRIAWCFAHDYQFLELIQAENAATGRPAQHH
jgi:hypothetical protein